MFITSRESAIFPLTFSTRSFPRQSLRPTDLLLENLLALHPSSESFRCPEHISAL
jgi:hypothetical protein